MNKKFLSAILFGALAFSTVTFTGCKDYDDDINSLQEQLDQTAKTANDALAAKAQELSSQISTLTTAKDQLAKDLEAAKADADAKVAAAQAAADKAQAAADKAQAGADGAQATADKAVKDAEDALARIAILEAQMKNAEDVLKKLEDADATLTADILKVNDLVKANDEKAAAEFVKVNNAIDAAKSELNAAIEGVKATLQDEITKVNKSISDTKAALEAADDALETADAALKAELETQKAELETLKGQLESLKAENEAKAAELTTKIADLDKAYKAADEVILGKVEANGNSIAANGASIAKLQDELAKANNALTTQQTALETYKTEVAEKLAGIYEKLEGVYTKGEVDGKIKEATDAISELNTTVGGLQAKWNQDITTALSNAGIPSDETMTGLQGQIDAILNTINGEENANSIQKQINAINTALTDYMKATEIQGKLDAITAGYDSEIEEIGTALQVINDRLDYISKLYSGRLTSLLFAPTKYYDGIEAVVFETLEYTPWATGDYKKPANATTGDVVALAANNKVIINDGNTFAHYYVSPHNINLNDVLGWKVQINDAENFKSRSAKDEGLTATVEKLENGKLTVRLVKNGKEQFAGEGNKFNVMALQATVVGDKTNRETKTVTSDWARIVELSVRPYIHNTNVSNLTEAATGAHFWDYPTIHDGAVDEAVNNTDGNYIVKEVVYNESLDLNTLVEVCDKNGKVYDAEDFGLKFEFEKMTYYLQDTPEIKTNQANFAVIDENGVITSRANDGVTVNNRDAIGREPMIRVILRDTKNNKVVDVRYFKIKWVAKISNTPLGQLGNFEDVFGCGETYEKFVGTDEMNSVYTTMNIDKVTFHELFVLDAKLYSSEADAAKGENSVAKLGDMAEIVAAGSTTTYNLKWSYDIVDALTKAEYEAGEIVKTVYGRYYNKTNELEVATFELKLTLKINKLAVVGYNSTQWDKAPVAMDAAKVTQVNPSLTDNTLWGSTSCLDCRIATYLTKSYNIAGGTVDMTNIVTYADKAWFTFDKKAIEVDKVLGTGWAVYEEANGDFHLRYNGENAVLINTAGAITLVEDPYTTPNAHGEPTKAAQMLLGKKVPVQLMGEIDCANFDVTVDCFDVYFFNPLKAVVNQEDTTLKDLLTGGSSIDISKALTLKETFGLKRNVIWVETVGGVKVLKKADGTGNTANLIKWYNVGEVTWDLAAAKTNLKLNDNTITISGSCNQDWSTFADKYELKLSADGEKLTFYNNSGSHLQQSFKVRIPVSIATKWNPALADPNRTMVELTIVPGDYEE